MTIVEKLKLLARLNSTSKEVEEGINMKDSTKVIVAIVGLLTTVVQLPSIQLAVTHFISTHAAVAAIVAGIATILALLHVPVNTDTLKKVAPILLIALLMLAPSLVSAQATGSNPGGQATADMQNMYAAGISYNVGGNPSIAGTGLYAHLIADTGTYAFTAVDALPNTVKPFTINTNFGLGVAQKIATLNKIPIYVPSAVGVSWTGSNTGWQWNAGALAAIHIKGNYYLMPSVRFLKSSVSNGTGYQPIVGVLFGWVQ